MYHILITIVCKFQSTSPVWRTTNFVFANCRRRQISIHVPRVEDDFNFLGGLFDDSFQSTSPVWRTTRGEAIDASHLWISIHVPRVEDD